MSDKNNGGPAFPCDDLFLEGGRIVQSEGLSVRDYFAAKAVAAIINKMDRPTFAGCYDYESASVDAYLIADAMLKARQA